MLLTVSLGSHPNENLQQFYFKLLSGSLFEGFLTALRSVENADPFPSITLIVCEHFE